MSICNSSSDSLSKNAQVLIGEYRISYRGIDLFPLHVMVYTTLANLFTYKMSVCVIILISRG